MKNFIFVPLYVDDRTKLKTEEQVVIRDRPRTLKTIGDKNLYYQTTRFNIGAQPYLVILNSDNEVIGTATYKTSSIPDFNLFLNNALEEFSK